jgi:ferredoxin
MSKKDGKATLRKSEHKKNVFVLAVCASVQKDAIEVAKACPVKIIKTV